MLEGHTMACTECTVHIHELLYVTTASVELSRNKTRYKRRTAADIEVVPRCFYDHFFWI